MKTFFLSLSALLAPLLASAIGTPPNREILTEIAYQGQSSKPHRYWLTEEKKNTLFKLSFEDGQKKVQSRLISKTQADFILNQATQIVWENQYLSTKQKTARCTPYAFLATAGEKSRVCTENRKAAAQSYGLFNAVRRMFQ